MNEEPLYKVGGVAYEIRLARRTRPPARGSVTRTRAGVPHWYKPHLPRTLPYAYA